MPANELLLKGSCFCGNLTYTVAMNGKPDLSAFCHCSNCQRLNSSPMCHTIHFTASSFHWTMSKSIESLSDSYVISGRPWKTRQRCKECGVCIASFNGKTGSVSIWGALLERDENGKIAHWDIVKPTAHIFYGTRLLDINDDLPKFDGYENKSTRLA